MPRLVVRFEIQPKCVQFPVHEDCIFSSTVKILKIGTPKIITRNCPTNGTVGFYSAVLRSKDADRITNRVDPDQTAPGGAV